MNEPPTDTYDATVEPAALHQIRLMLKQLTARNQTTSDADVALMRLCCIQLFAVGDADDVLRIWAAKESSLDSGCALEVQLLCGAGLPETKRRLAVDGSAEATSALAYIEECEAAGDFDSFSAAEQMATYARRYDIPSV